MNVSERTRTARARLGLTQQDIVVNAHEVGAKIHTSQVQHLEIGVTASPRVDTLERYAAGLGKSLAWLVGSDADRAALDAATSAASPPEAPAAAPGLSPPRSAASPHDLEWALAHPEEASRELLAALKRRGYSRDVIAALATKLEEAAEIVEARPKRMTRRKRTAAR